MLLLLMMLGARFCACFLVCFPELLLSSLSPQHTQYLLGLLALTHTHPCQLPFLLQNTVPGPVCPDTRPPQPQRLHQDRHTGTQPRPGPAVGGQLCTKPHKPDRALPCCKGHTAAAAGHIHAHSVQGSSSIWAVCVALVSGQQGLGYMIGFGCMCGLLVSAQGFRVCTGGRGGGLLSNIAQDLEPCLGHADCRCQSCCCCVCVCAFDRR